MNFDEISVGRANLSFEALCTVTDDLREYALLIVEGSERISHCNRALAARVGSVGADLQTIRWRDVCATPANAADVEAAVRSIAAGREPQAPLEIDLQFAREDPWPAEISLSRIAITDGYALCALVRDITERRRRDDIEGTLARYAEATSSAHDAGTLMAASITALRSVRPDISGCIRISGQTHHGEQSVWEIGQGNIDFDRLGKITDDSTDARVSFGAVNALPPAVAHILASAGFAGFASLKASADGGGTTLSLFIREPPWSPSERRAVVYIHDLVNAVQPRIQAERRLQLSESRLRGIAFIDPLTQLPNRSLLSDRIGQACAHARRSGAILAICYLDLDGFKAVNDTLGHERGDQLLQNVGQTLMNEMRAEDTAARVGGDEFVVLLGGIESEAEIGSSVDRILATIRRGIDELQLGMTVTVSAGVTLFPADNSPEETLLRHADQAMYVAKNRGRNQYHVFDASMSQTRDRLADARDKLSASMLGDRLTLLYQPQVHLKTGALTGLEALIRVRDGDGSLRLPTEFVGPGLDYDSIRKLDEWVIQHALRQLALWRTQGIEATLNVNINGLQLQHAGFADRLETFLWEYPTVPVGALCLEISETCALQNFDTVAANMLACKRLGIEFALDDFGTGFSSLTYLRRLPASRIKLDCSYVMGMLNNPDDFALVEGVLALARAFHRHATAEGVESELHGELLAAAGCDAAQGHVIARPMPASEVPRWLNEYRHPASWSTEGTAVEAQTHDGRLLRLALLHRTWLHDLLAHAEKRRPFAHDSATVRELADWCRNHGDPAGAHAASAFNRLTDLHREVLDLGVRLIDLRIAEKDDDAADTERSLTRSHREMLALLRNLSHARRGGADGAQRRLRP